MAMSRRDYTALAEWAGKVEAGRVRPDQIIDDLAEMLANIPGSHSFRPEKFSRHAATERDENQRIAVENLSVGRPFAMDGMLLIAAELHDHPADEYGGAYREVVVTSESAWEEDDQPDTKGFLAYMIDRGTLI